MMQIILGITGCLCLISVSVLSRHKSPWPREGHGRTYFMRTNSSSHPTIG